jgi:hypothetical protein
MDLHWGTMRRRYKMATARAHAVTALTATGYEVWSDPSGDQYFVLGGNDQVNVTILLVPEGNEECFVAVMADTSNGTAEAVRNKIRDLIPESPAPAPMPHLP